MRICFERKKLYIKEDTWKIKVKILVYHLLFLTSKRQLLFWPAQVQSLSQGDKGPFLPRVNLSTLSKGDKEVTEQRKASLSTPHAIGGSVKWIFGNYLWTVRLSSILAKTYLPRSTGECEQIHNLMTWQNLGWTHGATIQGDLVKHSTFQLELGFCIPKKYSNYYLFVSMCSEFGSTWTIEKRVVFQLCKVAATISLGVGDSAWSQVLYSESPHFRLWGWSKKDILSARIPGKKGWIQSANKLLIESAYTCIVFAFFHHVTKSNDSMTRPKFQTQQQKTGKPDLQEHRPSQLEGSKVEDAHLIHMLHRHLAQIYLTWATKGRLKPHRIKSLIEKAAEFPPLYIQKKLALKTKMKHLQVCHLLPIISTFKVVFFVNFLETKFIKNLHHPAAFSAGGGVRGVRGVGGVREVPRVVEAGGVVLLAGKGWVFPPFFFRLTQTYQILFPRKV